MEVACITSKDELYALLPFLYKEDFENMFLSLNVTLNDLKALSEMNPIKLISKNYSDVEVLFAFDKKELYIAFNKNKYRTTILVHNLKKILKDHKK